LNAPRPLAEAGALDLDCFDCVNDALNAWLRLRARANDTEAFSRAYTLARGSKPAGKFALSAYSIARRTPPRRIRHGSPDPLAAILLGQLAVARGWQGRGVGASLLQYAVRRFVAAADIVAARQLVTHPLDATAGHFHTRYGWTALAAGERPTLYVLLGHARAAMGLPTPPSPTPAPGAEGSGYRTCLVAMVFPITYRPAAAKTPACLSLRPSPQRPIAPPRPIILEFALRLCDKLSGPLPGARAMPIAPTAAQSEASRRNGAASAGPASAAGKARAALNGVRHGLCGRTFFLLPDEDAAEFARHEAMWLTAWGPRDPFEREAALAVIRATWRESRADRMEACVLADLFAADGLMDEAERAAAKAAALRAMNTLLRYRARLEREAAAARQELETLRQRRLAPAAPARRPDEPEPAPALIPAPLPPPLPAGAFAHAAPAARPDEPEPAPALNRHQRRALAAMERRRAA
jgi:GNAT superfamily N-acetyltransferase